MDATFIARMEQILHLYSLPIDAGYPLVCFDERPCFLIGDSVAGQLCPITQPKTDPTKK